MGHESLSLYLAQKFYLHPTITMGTERPSQDVQHAKNSIAASKTAGIKETVCSTITRTEETETFVAMLLDNEHTARY